MIQTNEHNPFSHVTFCLFNFRVTDASDSSTIIGTCTVAVTDVAPTFNSYCPEVVIADSVATGKIFMYLYIIYRYIYIFYKSIQSSLITRGNRVPSYTLYLFLFSVLKQLLVLSIMLTCP